MAKPSAEKPVYIYQVLYCENCQRQCEHALSKLQQGKAICAYCGELREAEKGPSDG